MFYFLLGITSSPPVKAPGSPFISQDPIGVSVHLKAANNIYIYIVTVIIIIKTS